MRRIAGVRDLFTCAIGKDMMPLIQRIKEFLGADNFTLRKIDRDADIQTRIAVAV